MKLSSLTGEVIRASMTIHTALGPGLLESAYRVCLVQELLARGLTVQTEVPLSISHRGVRIDVGYRMDLIVEERVLVELKAVQTILPVHEAQLLSYLKLGKFPVGLLINFHTLHLRDGIKRMVN